MIKYNSEHVVILTQCGFLILLGLIVHIIKSLTIKKVLKKLSDNKNLLNLKSFLISVNGPGSLLIWLFVFILIINVFKTHDVNVYLLIITPMIGQLVALLVIVIFVLKFIPKLEKNYHTKNKKKFVKLDKTATTALVQLTNVVIIIVSCLIALQTLGYSLTGLLAIGGASGIIVGLAAKDTIANLFGGIMLHIERPFALGDSILSNDHKSIQGTVEHIGLRTTRIITLEKRPLYIPNSLFMTITVENTTRMSNRRIKELVGVRYDDIEKLPVICKEIKEVLLNHDGIDQNLTILVNVTEFADYAVNILVFAFTKSGKYIDFVQIKEDILMDITKIVKRNGADFPYPTVTNYISNAVKIEQV